MKVVSRIDALSLVIKFESQEVISAFKIVILKLLSQNFITNGQPDGSSFPMDVDGQLINLVSIPDLALD